MRLLDRYIARTVLLSAVLTLLVVLSLEVVFDFLDEVEEVGRGDYSTGQALLYTLLSAPYRAYQTFPFATLIGSLLGLGAMAQRHELVVIRAAGVSVAGVARSVVLAGLVLAVLAFALGELVAPAAQRSAERLKAEAVSDRVTKTAGTGFWARDGQRFVEVARAPSPDRLEGLRVYRMGPEGGIASVLSAAAADYRNGQWVLTGAELTRLSAQGVTVERPDSRVWESDLRPQVLDVVVVEPSRLPIYDLITYIGYLERNGLESERYRLAFWIKVATPVAVVTMLVLTVPLVFGSLREKGIGRQLFLGILIGMAFYFTNRVLNYMGLVYGVPVALSALAPPLIFLAAGVWGIRRVR